MRSRRATDRTRAIWLHAALIPLAVLWLLPIWMMFVFSTLPESKIITADIHLWPGTEFLKNFRALQADVDFVRALIVSFVSSAAFMVLSVFLTSMAGWALANYNFVGKSTVLFIILGTLTLPYFVVVIPQFIMVARDFGLSNTWFALIVPGLFNSLGVLFMRQTFIMMPHELFDAARVEGVKEWRIYAYVAIPIARPSIAALAIILFLQSWNNYLWPLLINNDPAMKTAPVALGSLIGLTTIDWGGIMVGATLLTAPMLIVFIFLQRHFIAGISAGAIK